MEAKNILKNKNNILILPLIVFCVIHLIRPQIIGIYHDDWFHFNAPILMSSDELNHFLIYEIGARPLYAFSMFLIYKTWNSNIALLTSAMSTIVGFTSISLYYFLIKLFENEKNNKKIAIYCVSLWIAIPWGLGYSLWPTACLTLIGLSFFLWSQYYTIKYYKDNKKQYLLIASLLLIISYSMYQAMYFSFLITILYIMIDKKIYIKRVLEIIISLLIIQILFIILSKLYSGKSIDFNILLLIKNILFHLPKSIISPFGIYIVIPIIILILFIIQNSEFRKIFIKGFSKKYLVIFMIGILITTCIYTLAGYSIAGIGVMSRTTMGINIWIVVFIAKYMLDSINSEHNENKNLIYYMITAIIILFTISTLNQTWNWHKSWNKQKEILNHMPYEKLLLIPLNSVVLLNEPTDINGITVFGASWDITNAIYTRNEMSSIKYEKIKPLFVPLTDRIIKEKNIVLIENKWYPIKDLWIYTPSSKSLSYYDDFIKSIAKKEILN